MTAYANLQGNFGVDEYEITRSAIKVKFIDSTDVYVYSHTRPGKDHVDEMKRRAQAGSGLATYISRHIRENYDHKE